MSRFLLALACACLSASVSQAHIDRPERVAEFVQHPGQSLPLQSLFVDETGRRAPLATWVGSEPLVLVLGYLRCPELCDTTLAGVSESLDKSALVAGSDYRALFVSIDPGDSAPDAAAAREERLPAGQRRGWHFLTGDAASVAELARAVGFGFQYDPDRREYAHPAGFIVATPQGAVFRYFSGVRFAPDALRAALAAAAAGKTGTYADSVRLLCYHLDPAGRHTGAILNALRALVLGFVVAAAILLGVVLRRREQGAR